MVVEIMAFVTDSKANGFSLDFPIGSSRYRSLSKQPSSKYLFPSSTLKNLCFIVLCTSTFAWERHTFRSECPFISLFLKTFGFVCIVTYWAIVLFCCNHQDLKPILYVLASFFGCHALSIGFSVRSPLLFFPTSQHQTNTLIFIFYDHFFHFVIL